MKRFLSLLSFLSLFVAWSYATIVVETMAEHTTTAACYDIAVSPDGNTLYAVEKGANTIRMFNAKTMEAGDYLSAPATANTYGGCVAVDANGAIYGTYVVISGTTNVIIYKWTDNAASATVFKNLGTASTYNISNTYRSGYGMDVRVDANGNGFLLLPVPNNGTAAAGASVIYVPISNNVAGEPQQVVLSSTNWGNYPKVRIISDTQFWYDGNAARPYLVTIKDTDGTISLDGNPLLFPYKSEPAIFGAANGVSDFTFKGTRYALIGTNNHGTSSGYVYQNCANLYTITVGASITEPTMVSYMPEGGLGTATNTNGSIQTAVYNNGKEAWMYTSAMGSGNKICAFKMYDDADPTTFEAAISGKTIRRSVYYNGSFYILAVDGSKNPYLYKVNAETEALEAVLPTDFCSVSANGFYKLSDIAITSDGVLVGCNNEKCTTASTPGQYLKFYKWDLRTLTGEFWFSPENVTATGNPAAGNYANASSGSTMAYNGSLASGTISFRAQTLGSTNGKSRYGYVTISNGSPTVVKRSQNNTFMDKYDNVELTAAQTSGHFIFMSDTQAPLEFSLGTDVNTANEHGTFATAGVHGITFFTANAHNYMTVPSASDVKIYDVSSGLASASLISTLTYNTTATYRTAYGFKDGDDFKAYLLADNDIVTLHILITAESITLNESTIYLPVGGTFTLTPSILPVEASGNTITWTTGNSSIATVSEGVVTAVAIGSTTITAEVDGETATCTINVCAPVAHILPYELRRTDNGNGTYTFTFKSNTSATSGKIIFYQNGVKKGEVAIASSITAGANEVIIAKSALPQIEGVMTWSVELTGAESRVVGKLSDSADKYRYYHVRGISANVYPNTEGFGNIYITMPKDGGSDGSCTRTKEQTRGIFQLDAALNLKNPTNAGYTCGLSWPDTYYAPFRAAVGEDGLLYVSGNDESDSYKGVWVLDNPDASSGTFHSIISGTAEQGLCVTGTGSQKKLYTFEGSGTNGNIMEYAIGNNVPYTGAGTVISSAADAKMIFGRTTSATNVAADGNGGLWLYEYREAENSTYVCLSHLNSSRELDYNSNSAALGLTNSLRGGFAVNAKKNLIACGTKAKVTIFSVSWNGSGVPVLTKLYEIPISGNYIDGITFDYADNLYVITSSTEYLYVYALPTANNTTEVPAMSSLTVEAFDHIDVSSVIINEGAQSIERGNTFTFSATVLPADASDPSLTWASDNTSVATVNETTGEVTAVEVGTAHITATADGVTSAAVTVTVFKLDYDVTWEPNGATINTTAPASNNDLWTQFMPAYNSYYSLNRGEQAITAVATFAYPKMQEFMIDPASPWKWLGDYMLSVATAQGYTLDDEPKWRFCAQAFFNCAEANVYAVKAPDFTTAGQIENWLPLWKEANNYLPPTMRATDEMPVIRKGNDLLAGWYDNSSFTGAPVTSVTADMTLYAKWIAPIELDEASADNITKIEDNNGKLANVILRRTFEATGYWYTLVLPFDVSAEQMEETFGAGYEVTVLESSYRKSETVIYLKFEPRTYIKAGEPCLFKPGRDIDEAIFRGVTIDNTTPEVNTTIVNMVGLYAPTDVTLSDNNYYLGSTNYLHEYVAMYQNTKGFRAYFHFNEAMAAGCSARVVFREDTATELEDLPEVNTPAVQKVIRDGQLIIIREGKEYTAQGQLIQ